ncbi:pyruvate dehydrogenase complex dihydrolipoyllysine-residue acetyltransferase [Saccharospirillum salsuginis]|uniref:Acetyltransferase component of pyruvate dehydrogenase complex n=1 Tax=Saccharospirillum salsuginis TaxID=418750 RepID=A0A918K0C4_9GAMM|nr:pyruvate dehydrogenase complex dihydrolipoyllysine-residue acetyltransferase [Saccharospirillum salsuginis]GGX39570.1 acetyltransferase component of pyruvate dehydrogenase complex [Saccharospirillum salsuginis]
MATEIIKVPDLGMDSASVIEVSVKEGDTIAEEDTLIVLESDKASMDVPSPKAGKVTQIKVSEGESLAEGDEILYLEVEGASGDADESDDAPQEETAEPSQAAASASGGSVEEVKVPDIGMDNATIVEINVKVGDTIAEEDPIVTLESDKASMEVPSDKAGEVVSIQVKEGDSISEGSVLIEVKTGAGGGDTAEASKPSDSAPKSKGGGESVKTVNTPDLGDASDVDVIEVNVKPGDTLNVDDPICVLETDKASMEVPATEAGEVVEVLINTGDKVSEGMPLLKLKVSGGSDAESEEKAASEKPAPAETPAPKAATQEQAPSLANAYDDAPTQPSKPVHAGPAVRKLAREFGVDLALVPGSGPKGRIVKDDVAGYVKKRLQEPTKAAAGAGIPEIPDQDFSKFGEVEIKDLNRIQQITAQNMARNWLNIPHVTQFDEADVTDTEAFRQSLKPQMEKRGVKISPLAFIVKAAASALEEFPQFNVSLMADGKRLVQKHYVNIGLAVDTPNGLIVPVIRDADKKSIWQIAEEIIDYAKRGRDGKVKSDEMKGGCFTVSSLGGLGGTAFTPIVNAPEVAILGVSKNQVKPHWTGSEFVPRTFTPLSLSYDHRAVNGADAAKFTTYLCEVLTDIRRLVL